ERVAVTELKNTGTNFILYFSYDGFDIDESATAQIIKHANFMRDNSSVNLRLEGHADERGTREYNLALGENRALSVKEVLGLYDLSSRVEVISFGEEKPIAQSHDEAGWKKNRRVEFIYQ
ncbi:MAG: OmpA family protein, partial [Candidatus Thioglobus sp.]|nr:OmpA family protein [Candidatus Thioglobus sp.]